MANWVLDSRIDDSVAAASLAIDAANARLGGSWRNDGVEWLKEPFAVLGKGRIFDTSPRMLKLYKKNNIKVWKNAVDSVFRTFDGLSFAFAKTTISSKDSSNKYTVYVCAQIVRSLGQNRYRYGSLIVSDGMLEDESTAMALQLKSANIASKHIYKICAAVFCLVLSLIVSNYMKKSQEKKQQMLATYDQLISEDRTSSMSVEDCSDSKSDEYRKVLEDIDAKFPKMCSIGKRRLATYVRASRLAKVDPIINKHYCRQLSRAIDVLVFMTDSTTMIIDFKFSNTQENVRITITGHDATKILNVLLQKIHEHGSQQRD